MTSRRRARYGPAVDQSGPEGVPAIRNVTVENLTCDAADAAIVLRGLPDSPITGVALRHSDWCKTGVDSLGRSGFRHRKHRHHQHFDDRT
jgi:hypothetical protein